MKKLQDKKEEQEKKIAVIEEVADNIYSIKFILQSIGYEVTSVSSRDSYQPMLKEFLPDLIIIDMMIAGGGGYEAIRQLGKSSLKRFPYWPSPLRPWREKKKMSTRQVDRIPSANPTPYRI